ncbi:hypothetical protein DRW03_23375 [Corallococcus sp. H22C18031201]|nr:hypothetical protein DRW03_23375 [Corallococcus sp. H22C18031201]
MKEDAPSPPRAARFTPNTESFHMPAQKGNRSKKKLANRAKSRKSQLKRRRVRAKRGQRNNKF